MEELVRLQVVVTMAVLALAAVAGFLFALRERRQSGRPSDAPRASEHRIGHA